MNVASASSFLPSPPCCHLIERRRRHQMPLPTTTIKCRLCCPLPAVKRRRLPSATTATSAVHHLCPRCLTTASPSTIAASIGLKSWVTGGEGLLFYGKRNGFV